MNPEQLDRLVAWMREKGVVALEIEGTKLQLGPAPPAPVPEARPMTDEEMAKALAHQKKRLDQILFASTEGFPEDFEEDEP